MNKIKKIALITGAICAATALTISVGCGCKTVPDANGNMVKVMDTNRVDAVAKQAAIDGTVDLLQQHPEWRQYFQQAEDDLNTLTTSPSISLNDILTIVQRLPVTQLKSNTAKIAFEGATLTIALFDVPQLPSQANADLQSLARALADGLATALAEVPAPTATSTQPLSAPVSAPPAPAPSN